MYSTHLCVSIWSTYMWTHTVQTCVVQRSSEIDVQRPSDMFTCVCTLSRFSCVQLFTTPWTTARQALRPGALQARTLEPSSRASSRPRDGTLVSCVSCIGRRVLYHYRHLGSPRMFTYLTPVPWRELRPGLPQLNFGPAVLQGLQAACARGQWGRANAEAVEGGGLPPVGSRPPASQSCSQKLSLSCPGWEAS